jgi:H+/Cl- antiporter ClcA
MQYVWIIIVILIWLVWGVLGVRDVIEELDGQTTIEDIIEAISRANTLISWLCLSLFVLFMASLIAFLIGRLK